MWSGGKGSNKPDAGDAVIFINDDELSEFVKLFEKNDLIRRKGVKNQRHIAYINKLNKIINEEGVICMSEFKFTPDGTTLQDEFIASGGWIQTYSMKKEFDLTLTIEG